MADKNKKRNNNRNKDYDDDFNPKFKKMKKKVCPLCGDKNFVLDFKNSDQLRKFVNDEVRIPVYIIIISTIVTIIQMILNKYSKPLYDAFGIYLPLVIVNCVILGRALSFASNQKLIPSIKDALKNGIGYTIAISIIGLLRELLGNGTITIMDKISSITGYREIVKVFNEPINKLFLTSGGAFILLGIIIAVINGLRGEEE